MYRFEHINALYFLSGLFIILLVYGYYRKWRTKRLQILADIQLHNQIISNGSISNSMVKFLIYNIVFILLIISIANLQIGGKIDKKEKLKTIDMILAVDISHSMLAEDIKPSRIERAKMFCMKLAEEIKFAKFGIVLFTGDAYIHLPVTSDPGAVKMFISSISTELLSVQGTAIGKALSVSADAFEHSNAKNKAVILITDGENFEDDASEAAKIAGKENIVIHTVSIGTSEGGSIPMKKNGINTGFKKDGNGNIVITKPDFLMLSEIASQTGGISVNGNQQRSSVVTISKVLEKLERVEGKSVQFSEWDTLFYLFTFPALILMILDFFLFENKMKWQEFIQSQIKLSLIQKNK